MTSFAPLTLADRPLFREFEQRHPLTGSDCNFTNLLIWRNYYRFTWAQTGDSLCIRAAPEGQRPFCLPPLGDPRNLEAWDFLAESLEEPFFSRVPEGAADAVRESRPGWLIVPDRDNDDYVYSNSRLITLSGRIMHQKKNHFNYFRQNCPHEVLPITRDLFPELESLSDRWIGFKTERGWSESHLSTEKEAIAALLGSYEELGVYGAAIKVSGRIEAFSIGEMLNPDTIVVHVEKGNPEIRGIYVAICSNFCRMLNSEAEFVNREQDLGIPGLRQSKLSLKPLTYVRKFAVYPKGAPLE
jgi:hypothetical protein